MARPNVCIPLPPPNRMMAVIQVMTCSKTNQYWQLDKDTSCDILLESKHKSIVRYHWNWNTDRHRNRNGADGHAISHYELNSDTYEQTNPRTKYVRNFQVAYVDVRAVEHKTKEGFATLSAFLATCYLFVAVLAASAFMFLEQLHSTIFCLHWQVPLSTDLCWYCCCSLTSCYWPRLVCRFLNLSFWRSSASATQRQSPKSLSCSSMLLHVSLLTFNSVTA